MQQRGRVEQRPAERRRVPLGVTDQGRDAVRRARDPLQRRQVPVDHVPPQQQVLGRIADEGLLRKNGEPGPGGGRPLQAVQHAAGVPVDVPDGRVGLHQRDLHAHILPRRLGQDAQCEGSDHGPPAPPSARKAVIARTTRNRRLCSRTRALNASCCSRWAAFSRCSTSTCAVPDEPSVSTAQPNCCSECMSWLSDSCADLQLPRHGADRFGLGRRAIPACGPARRQGGRALPRSLRVVGDRPQTLALGPLRLGQLLQNAAHATERPGQLRGPRVLRLKCCCNASASSTMRSASS